MPHSTRSVNHRAMTSASGHAMLVGPLFWEALPGGRLTQDLPAWRAYTGQPEPLSSASWLDGVLHPEDRAATTLAWASALRGGQAFSISHRLRAADGTYRPFLTQARPVFDDAGTVVRYQGVTCDLTEVERDANRLSGQAAAFGVIRESVILTDQDLRVLDWNLGAEALFGYTHAEALGQNVTMLHPATDEQGSPHATMDHVRRLGRWEGELPFVRKDGTRGTCAVVAQPLEDEHGEPMGAIWLHRDITTRTSTEAEMERLLERERAARRDLEASLGSAQVAEAQLHMLMERNIIGVFLADADHIVEANDAFLRMFGYDRADVANRALRWQQMTPPGWEEADDQASHELLTRGACAPYEKEYLRRDGTRVPVILAGVLLSMNPLHLMGFVLDITDRKQLEREVAARAVESDAIVEAMPAAVVLFDADGRIHRMNARARAFYTSAPLSGTSRESLSVRASSTVMRDEGGQPLPADQWPTARVLRGETLLGERESDVHVTTHDGKAVQFSVTGAPLLDETGRILGGVVIYQDVTSRRELERAAAARAAELETVLDTMTDAVYVYDQAGHIIRTNAAARALNPRITETSYQGETFASRIQRFVVRDAAGEPQAPDQTPVARTLRGERVTAAETVMRLEDGRDIRLSTSGAPIRNAKDQISGAVSVVRDVTDRYALEQRNLNALQALLAMARALVVEDAAAGAGPAGTWAERVAARVAELTRQVLTCQRATLYRLDAPGKRLRPLAHAEQHARLASMTRQTRGGDIATTTGEGASLLARLTAGDVVIEEHAADLPRRNTGASAGVVAVSVPMRVAGELIGMMRVVYGAHDRARLNEERRLAEAVAQLAALVIERERLLVEREEARANELALREANRRMEDFLGIASHELKTPLTAIKSSIQVLGRRVTRGETLTHDEVVRLTVRSLDGMARGTTRMERLINDLLDVSRIREGRLDFLKEPCDLLEIVRAGVEEAHQLQPERTIRLAVPDGATEVPVIASADRIGQVLANYLMNALKYSPLDRSVEVAVRDAGDNVRVSVCDEGPGLASDQQRLVWDLFHRVPGIEVQHGSGIGLGLGLHISRSIVERHGGTVGVDSALGHGSIFWFELPRALPHTK